MLHLITGKYIQQITPLQGFRIADISNEWGNETIKFQIKYSSKCSDCNQLVEATVELVSLDNIIEWSAVELCALCAGNVGDKDREGSVLFTNKFASVVRGVEVYDTLNVLDKTWQNRKTEKIFSTK